MVFSSIPFVFFFLPACLILYYAAPFRLKNYVLLFFSLLFYAWGEPVYILLMLFVTMVDYTAGRLMERAGNRKIVLILAAGTDLACLGFFKYADFFVRTVNGVLEAAKGTTLPLPGISLPIGISFFTFQSMSYTIDRCRGEVPEEKNYLSYLTYVSMFPQLIAGPIVRFRTVNRELHERAVDRACFEEGVPRFLRGLFRKVLIANNVGAVWEQIRDLQAAGGASAATAWLGAVLFTLQLYFDFSAYSDMAIGMGRMLGFHFLENFNYPLSAVSVTDFWRRWHISLSTWFRDYVYIPLGGNRRGTAVQIRNMFVVWFLTGLWHGASWNFVIWGLYYGVLLALEKFVWGKALEKLPRVLRHLYAFLIVVFGFVIFVFDDSAALRSYLSTMFCLGTDGGSLLIGHEFFWYFGQNAALILLSLVLSFPVWPRLRERVRFPAGTVVFYACLFLLSTAWMVSETYNPFLYFRF
ncbi:MAG: MBOAT family protein [Stomatobaculum sp.]|nr:MBOAT family protein [Stomatobaculum sp.]